MSSAVGTVNGAGDTEAAVFFTPSAPVLVSVCGAADGSATILGATLQRRTVVQVYPVVTVTRRVLLLDGGVVRNLEL
jgi:hypothetical protein